ncbi:cytochrome P450 [Gymnopus androsaceus JB14]|uniref:Cytochrome P450 n=1 Tax=Gymnopus androsaceus JB14 TaxID=1447944 RepID=A0A6A4HW78_9AGAR|nr:cytochrome P450 [Gymnopus androsaceus JB14]
MFPSAPYAAAFGLGLIIFLLRYLSQRSRILPPGPRGIPFLGNALQLGDHPKTKLWTTFGKWGREFGSLVYLNLAGQDVVVLNNRATATELLYRRSVIYSDRPKSVVLEYLGAPLTLFLTCYGKKLQAMRRKTQSVLNAQISKEYCHVQADEATLLVYNLLSLSSSKSETDANTQSMMNIFERSTASAIVSIIYGFPSLSLSDPVLSTLNYIAARFTHAALPGSFFVELLPALDWIPSWTGMAKWKSDAKRDRKMIDETFTEYYKHATENHEQKTNVCSKFAELGHGSESDKENAWLAGMLYLAGAETTTIALSWLIYSMTLFPEVQARGQEEIDRVVGRDRLPNFGDMGELVYVQAMVKEILRWQPVIPLALPHRLMEDDWYEGYLIPKGASCMPNIQDINRDLETYGPDASEFRPERFIDYSDRCAPKIRDGLGGPEGHYTFGFGRRICPGLNVANNALFIDTCMILWALNVEPEPTLGPGVMKIDIMNHPPHFGCKWIPRFPDTESMLRDMQVDILNARHRNGSGS